MTTELTYQALRKALSTPSGTHGEKTKYPFCLQSVAATLDCAGRYRGKCI
jgi:hypothetical protein